MSSTMRLAPSRNPSSPTLKPRVTISGAVSTLPDKFVDRDDGQHDAVFADVAAVFDDEIFDHVGAAARIDADAAHIDFAGFARAEFVEFQNVAAFDQHDFADRAVHGAGHFGVQLQLPVLAVHGNEVARLHQIDDELEFFLAGVPADVDRRRGPVFVDDVGFAAEKVVDHPVDRFLVARE